MLDEAYGADLRVGDDRTAGDKPFADLIHNYLTPRSHLQHYHGVFASNAPFRKQITAHANKLMEEHVPAIAQAPDAQKTKSSYSWAKLLARVYEVFPLICTCGEVMKIIAFITNPHTARQILAHLKLNTNPFDPIPLELEEWENSSQIAVEPEYEMSQLIPGTHDGFPEIEEQVHYHAYHAGPDPPCCSQLIDPPHCEYECDSPHWED